MPRRIVLLYIFLAITGFVIYPGFVLAAVAQEATPTPTPISISISSPFPGQALQGKVIITGYTAVDGFQASELEFGYMGDSTNTWFFIYDSTTPVSGGELATWDTTTLTDGNYTLRLTIYTQSGIPLTATVSGLRIRNYSPVETDTPTPPAPTSTPLPGKTPEPTATLTPTASPIPATATPLPPNPVQLTDPDLFYYLVRGVLIAIAGFAVFGLLVAIRKYLSHS